MGTSNKLQDINLDITQFKCRQCQQTFTKQDKANNNWDLWWDTSGEVLTSTYQESFVFSHWVLAITHQNIGEGFNCPEALPKKEASHV